MTYKVLKYDDLGIVLADIFEQMGYHGVQPDEKTKLETQTIIHEVRQWLRPQFCYMIVRELPAFRLGKIIQNQLRGADAYALFTATSGMEYEDFQQRLTVEGDMVRVFIADALGSVIAEKCADQMETSLQESIEKLAWKHTNRFSPGYCGWHVSEQKHLFSLFDTETPCGIHLTDSSLMVPIKSVSGIIGIGKNVRKQEYACGRCDFEKCYKRRKA